ncbi:histidine kinase [Leptospira sp. 96542]|nr:histidine kinase [Leptospira sp. 96542]
MKGGFDSWIDKPILSISIFTLVFTSALVSIAYNKIKSKDSSITEYYFLKDGDYFLGDIPPLEDGNYDFPKMKKVNWKTNPGWIDSNELNQVADSEFIWMRIPAVPNHEKNELYSLLKHQAVQFELFTDTGEKFFRYGSFDHAEPITHIFDSKFHWVKIPSVECEYYYLRIYHKKGYLFSISIAEDLVGQQHAVYKEIAIRNFTPILFHSFFLMIGFICAVVYFIEFKKRYNMVLDFALFAILFGMIGLSTNVFVKYIFSKQQLFFIFDIISSNFVFIPMLSGLRRLFGSERFHILTILIYTNLFLACSIGFLLLLLPYYQGIHTMLVELRLFFILFSISNILGPVYVAFDAWRKGNQVAFGHFIGFSITFVLVLIEIYLSIQTQSGLNRVIFWGVLFGVISQGLALERLMFSHRQNAQVYKEDLLKAEKLLKESQLKTLQTKMSPHYLFNSLNTIHALHKINPDLIPESILRLANNYRFISDRTDREVIPFEEEWNFLDDYLHLQRLRFFDTIKIEFKKTGDFSDVVIPPLLFQPIIENSFKHGFRTQVDTGWMVFIHAKMIKDKTFQFTVYDNGSGIPEDILADKEKLFMRSLGNIKERLSNTYSEFSFDVGKNFPSGTRTTIVINVLSKVSPSPLV